MAYIYLSNRDLLDAVDDFDDDEKNELLKKLIDMKGIITFDDKLMQLKHHISAAEIECVNIHLPPRLCELLYELTRREIGQW